MATATTIITILSEEMLEKEMKMLTANIIYIYIFHGMENTLDRIHRNHSATREIITTIYKNNNNLWTERTRWRQ